jgi:hypothetical protein
LSIRHPPEEMISIPNCPDLIAEVSAPLAFRTETGKVKIESKKDMARRGVKSPDHADALVLAFMAEPADFRVHLAPRSETNVVSTMPADVFRSE